MSEMKWHPAACIFPMLPDDELRQLADDIKTNGQNEPCVICDGMVLDGRNRWMACKLLGIKAKTVNESPTDPVAYVMSMNLHRRHLTPSQASMCAARARDLYEQQAKERQKRKPAKSVPENLPELVKGDARDLAGKAFGVSGKSVDHASKIIGSESKPLIKAVDDGRIAVSKAVKLIDKPAAEQVAEIEAPKGRALKKKPVSSKQDAEPEPGVSRGVGIRRAHEAIACLKRIPKRDRLRSRAFEIVSDWIKENK